MTAGEGPLVLLLHGFPEFWYSWRKQIPALSRHFKVVAPDLRGYNLSDKPKGAAAYTMDKIARDVLELIAHFGYQKAHLVAHDWGGAAAWAFAVFHPEALDHLVILNSPHPVLFRNQLKTNARQRRRSWYMGFFQVPLLPEMILKTGVKKFITSSLRGWAIRKEAFSDQDLIEYIKAFKQPGAANATLNYYRSFPKMAPELMRMLGNEIHSPTMVIWGQNDTALGPELTDGLEKFLKGEYILHKVENCSHWVQHEVPEQVNEWLVGFLRGSGE